MSPFFRNLLICLAVGSMLGSVAAHAARLVSTMTCRDVEANGTIPIGIQEQFAVDAPAIHLVAIMSDVAPATKVKAVWVSVNAIDVPNYAIDSAEVTANDAESRLHFKLSKPNNGWPTGDYEILLYVEEAFISKVPFKVTERQTSARQEQREQPASAPSTSHGIIGCWLCQDAGESSLLEFRIDHIMLYDGEAAQYSLSQTAVQMQTEFGPIDYPYTLSGNSLQLVFPGGYQIACTRTQCRSGQAPAPQTYGQDYEYDQEQYNQGGYPQQTAPQGGGGEYQLRGMFCHWSGSSSSYSGSSYSSSVRVSFDGQGNFSTGSESSYSGNEGLAYGGGGDGGGTYRIVGNEVHLMFSDGSTGVAQISNRGGDGSVTELMYNGDLYAPQLCD